jgi:hypothetical protein
MKIKQFLYIYMFFLDTNKIKNNILLTMGVHSATISKKSTFGLLKK